MDISRVLLLFLLMKTVCVSTAFFARRAPMFIVGTIATTQLNLFSSIENLLFGTLEQNQGVNPIAYFLRLSTGNETSIQQAHERESCSLATFTCGRLN
jgi:hypothetical protein